MRFNIEVCTTFFTITHVAESKEGRLRVDGKFFKQNGQRIELRVVTYGPFPLTGPDHQKELYRIASTGFNAIRLYEPPSEELLDVAERYGLMVMAGVPWAWQGVFLGDEAQAYYERGKFKLVNEVSQWGRHPAVVALYVANEIPSSVARWMGPTRVRQALEELIDAVREVAPHLLVAYANYPTSEYLEPANADFTGFNIYLETEQKLASYLPRLHHLAGDRPVVISEFGLDSRGASEEKQAKVIQWFMRAAREAGMAGWTIFAWSDLWRVGARSETDWDFGLTRRDGTAKPALTVAGESFVSEFSKPLISVIVCVYNGEDRIAAALDSLQDLDYPAYEVIVVDDGSTDATRSVVASYPYVKLVAGEHAGLSVARNTGAAVAQGEILAYTDDDCEVDRQWLYWLAKGYAEHGWDACGGPNIPPEPFEEDEAVVAAAPGAPSHVMLDDQRAEHIPGCNLSVTKQAFERIGGFRATYRVAGDDVDFCWRLEAAGLRIGFHGAAFVWHRRRTSLMRYFKQQWGYGKAEALLMRDFPEKFSRGHGARWEGCVYTGAAVGAQEGSVIYHGPAGLSGYQQILWQVMPTRRIQSSYTGWRSTVKLVLAQRLQPWLRRISRRWYSREWIKNVPLAQVIKESPKLIGCVDLVQREWSFGPAEVAVRDLLVERLQHLGWSLAGDYSCWDLQRGGTKLLLLDEWRGENYWLLKLRGEGELKEMLPLAKELEQLWLLTTE